MDDALLLRVTEAAVAEDLFGALAGSTDEQLRALAAAYRRIARAVHPDRNASANAPAAFVKATRLRDEAEAKLRAHAYGHGRPPLVLGRDVLLFVARGDLCDLYARGDDLVKLARSGADSDLLEREADALRRLWPDGEREARFYRYLPRLLESFVLRDENGAERRANVMPRFPEHVSLADVLEAFPRGADFRDAVWMLKRVLVALGFVHRRGLVHGAVLPPHVLVHPIDHGARIVDWCYSAEIGDRVRARVRAWEDLYAPEIAAREPATAATDMYMAAKCALRLLGTADAPHPLLEFLATCTVASPARRPDDAWALHEELDALLLRLVGKPTYRPLTITK